MYVLLHRKDFAAMLHLPDCLDWPVRVPPPISSPSTGLEGWRECGPTGRGAGGMGRNGGGEERTQKVTLNLPAD